MSILGQGVHATELKKFPFFSLGTGNSLRSILIKTNWSSYLECMSQSRFCKISSSLDGLFFFCFFWFLRFFTSIPWVFFPAQILLIAQTTLIRYSFFLSSFFLYFFILEYKKTFFFQFLLFFSVFSSALYLVFFSILLSFHFSFPNTLFCLLLPYVLLLFNLFSFCFSSSFKSLLSNTYLLSILFLFLFSLNTFLFWWGSYDISVISFFSLFPFLLLFSLFSLCSFLYFLLILFVLFLLFCFLSVLLIYIYI